MVICLVLPNVVIMQTLQAAAAVVFRGHATNLAVVHSALLLLAILGLLTHSRMHTKSFSHNIKIEGWILCFDGLSSLSSVLGFSFQITTHSFEYF
jgi:hypothetical protein